MATRHRSVAATLRTLRLCFASLLIGTLSVSPALANNLPTCPPPNGSEWLSATLLPGPLETFAAATDTPGADPYLYILGGLNSNTDPEQVSDKVFRIKINTSDGSLMGGWGMDTLPFGGVYRYNCGVTYNSSGTHYLYRVGGIDDSGNNTPDVWYSMISSTNGAVNNWTHNQGFPVSAGHYVDLPAVRQLHGTVVVGNFLYVIGGSNAPTADNPGGTNGANIRSSVFYAKINSNGSVGQYDGGANGWTTTQSVLRAPVYKTCPIVLGSTIYVIGGESNSPQSNCAMDGTGSAIPNVYYATQTNATTGALSDWQEATMSALPCALAATVTASVPAPNQAIVLAGGDATGHGGDICLAYKGVSVSGLLTWSTSDSFDLPFKVSRNAGAKLTLGSTTYVYSLGGLKVTNTSIADTRETYYHAF